MGNIGSWTNTTIRDTRGTSYNSVDGSNNNVRYVGDNGANTFRVGGTGNNVSIENIGRDERIMLEGRPQDWALAPDCNPRDGKATYINRITGNSVTVKTDGGRNDAFVQSKVSFTGDYASLANPFRACASFGGWNQLGNMAMNPGCFDPIMSAYAAGYSAGRRDGFVQGALSPWAQIAALPFGCWSLLGL